jgi:hypothetical protein
MTSSGADQNAVSDFTITHNAGGVMSIAEERQITYAGTRHGSLQASSTIGYDFNRTIPTSVKEISTGRVQQGSDYRDIKSEITMNLTSDSMAKASH